MTVWIWIKRFFFTFLPAKRVVIEIDEGPGWVKGPTLTHSERPWPIMWEQLIDDSCAHLWERCLLLHGPERARTEFVIRCAKCHVPRCGHSQDDDPCMERRHHSGVHIYLSGWFEPLGGVVL